MKHIRLLILVSMLVLSGISCSKVLEEPVYSELVPENFLNTEDGIVSVLKAAYVREAHVQGQNAIKGTILSQEAVTDIMYEYAGADNRQMLQFLNFTWDANLDWLYSMLWIQSYYSIRDANSVLDNIDKAEINDDNKSMYMSEARFIRAACYYSLYSFFGPVPLRTTTLTGAENLARATDEEMKSFIESEFLAAIPSLPEPGSEEYGRANKGAARAFLAKFYLNTKQWQKCADICQTIIGMGKYTLHADYTAMFKVENERNSEYMWVRPCYAYSSGPVNDWEAYVFPSGFQSDPTLGITYISNWRNYAAMYTLRDAFFNSFAANDKRRSIIMTSYVNTAGVTINLNNGTNNTRPIKYWPDPNAISGGGGNDIPVIRYADILLSRAESLNELNGPTQESVQLINQIRKRAGLGDIAIADFGTKDALREQILKERGWEFYCEGLRRQDLIRMGKLISYALARGVTNAKNYHVLYPIPQTALDADPLITQNEGY